MPTPLHQRGEGKVGCMLTMAVLLALGAAGVKIVPVYYANNAMADAADDLATKAGILTVASIEQQLQARARELEIPEALAKGAITVKSVGEDHTGTCTIRLHYKRKVDLYGAYKHTVAMDKVIIKPYMDVR